VADALRRAARRFATGVTIVAVRQGTDAHALTANSFVTLSLNPALVGVSVKADGRLRRIADEVRSFGVSVLNGGQGDYARHYARRERTGEASHLGLLTLDTPARVPIVPNCVAYFVCDLQAVYPIGDHDLMVGAVLMSEVADPDQPPLIFLDGELQHGDPGPRRS
jgi:flavin reductase (DIM6/NTAB) family NADH-FMN oxidoreductase RutF